MRLFFSVGEPSGDEHAARLIGELRRRLPGTTFEGYGGPKMAEAGCQLQFPLTELAVMGFAAVLPRLPRFIQLARRARQQFLENPPDAVVLVDFPGFNFWIARYAHAANVPVFYYLPPQLWAWASHRVRRMRRDVDGVLCCLPFEPDWYAERGVAADFVGHPIFDELAEQQLDEGFLSEQRARGGPIVGVLPGSRNSEVARHFPVQLGVMNELYRRFPSVRFLVANYRTTHETNCRRLAARQAPHLPIELYSGKTSEIIELAETCLMVSGSVSLELLARTKPAVVMYRVSRPMYWLMQHLLQCSYISLPNLFADRMLFPEFYLTGPTRPLVRQMADQLHWWLTDPRELALRRTQIAELRQQTAVRGAVARAADVIAERLLVDLDRLAA
jgi:lipid-A-disaccharide synthase